MSRDVLSLEKNFWKIASNNLVFHMSFAYD
ncbi:hypothetical protein EAG_03132 [Camponotus floridanus]|uniref:Uncharacterized protein n=1 Tax=Camponotus floridanus TaxID=104421 RepID=E2ATB9_CAMFO|nr:hypothetical protein EAG_03132 [Camponotus floridanus]